MPESLKDAKSRLIAQLSNHGHTNLQNLTPEELNELFTKTTIEWSAKMVDFNLGKKNVMPKNANSAIRDRLKKSDDFYGIFGEFLAHYPYMAICEVVANIIPALKVQKALLILEIKYRQYQEIIIEQIEQKIATFMPQEECATFMLFIENNREEVELLKGILAQLNDDKIAQNISKITNAKKYIISEFMPSDMEKNYKQFYNHSKDKQELVAQLRQISSAYSKKQLDDMSKEDLTEILNSIRQREISEKKDADDFDKYMEAFKMAMYDEDSSVFDVLVVRMLNEVSKDCLANLKAHLRLEDPLFETKFIAAQKEWDKVKQ